MPRVHAIELPRDVHAVAKATAKIQGLSLSSYLTGLIEEYGSQNHEPLVREEPDIVRVRIGITDAEWDAAAARAKAEGKNVTIALVDKLKGKS